jgi:hypothetical protein
VRSILDLRSISDRRTRLGSGAGRETGRSRAGDGREQGSDDRREVGGSQVGARREPGVSQRGVGRVHPQGKHPPGSCAREATVWIPPQKGKLPHRGSSRLDHPWLQPCSMSFSWAYRRPHNHAQKKNIPKAEQASKRTGAHMSVHRTSSLGGTSLSLMDTMSQLDATLTWPIWTHTATVYGHGAHPVRLRN